MKKVVILGSTGSIGSNTLDLMRRLNSRFSVAGLSANVDKSTLDKLAAEFGCHSTLTSVEGNDGIARLLDQTKPDIVVNGIAGAAGLIPSKLCLERGIDLALANKETVVMAWPLIKKLASDNNATIIPVDSEHSAIFNLIKQCGRDSLDEIVITASGGPFRDLPSEELQKVTLADALKHPTWKMGKKITVDSASLANKGLEVIEACRLFDMPTDKIKVIVHPESLIHSLVRTKDGMLYAQISDPDMRHPILGALCYPDVIDGGLEKFSLGGQAMTFFEPRWNDFPLLSLAYDSAKKGRSYTIAFNAADEIAAHAFIDGKTGFTDISRIVSKVMDYDWSSEILSFDDVFEKDQAARAYAGELV